MLLFRFRPVPVLLRHSHTVHRHSIHTARLCPTSSFSSFSSSTIRSSSIRLPLLTTSAVLGFSLPFLTPHSPTHLESTTTTTSSSSPAYAHSQDVQTPLTTGSRSLSPAAVKQISLGSILGLGAGVLVSAFSRTLTLLFGVGIVLVQYAARKGYNIIPVERMQRYVRGVNLKSAINDNVAFKMTFGLTFALAAFGEF